jgi:cell division protein FtsN
MLLVTGGLANALGPGEAPVGARVRERLAAPAPAATLIPTATGRWKIQVGAFRDASAAQARLREIGRLVPALAGRAPAPDVSGQIRRVRIGGIGDGAEAARLCAGIARAGIDCFAVAPGP